MNRHGSIRFRLTAWYAAILAVTFAAVGIGVWVAMRESVYETVDRDLRSRLQAMREFLQAQSTDIAEELAENAALAPAGTRFRLADVSGRWVFQSPGTQSWDAAPLSSIDLPRRGNVATVNAKGRHIRVLSAPVETGVIQIGVPIGEYIEMLDGFTWTALVASPVLLFLASLGGYWMSRRALAPVDRIATTAGEIEARNLAQRLPVSGTGDELDHLSSTLNAMFGRLEDSFRRITQFTADASHELRTPVAIIRTTAEVARRRPRAASEYEAALDRILAESERTSELIEDLMLLARADAHIEEFASEPVELVPLVKQACSGVRVLAEARGLELAIGALESLTISGDSRSLRRLILVLLDNAIKYSKPGGRIDVGVTLCNTGAPVIARLEVRDDGAGIAAEDLPHVFERFYRASKDRSRAAGGAGLGLSIARAIVERHGGKIELESTLGEGTTARVFLPQSLEVSANHQNLAQGASALEPRLLPDAQP